MSVQVNFEGRLVADAEFHAVGSEGAGFLKFRIASRRGYANKNTNEYGDPVLEGQLEHEWETCSVNEILLPAPGDGKIGAKCPLLQ